MKRNKAAVERKMQNCLISLGIPLRVQWSPKSDSNSHGEIHSNVLSIHDMEESEAWMTFEHEVYEYKFKEVTYAYRLLANNLIGCFEALVYERKEKFLESLPRIVETISKERNSS